MHRFSTNAVHAGADRDALGAVSPPLYLSTNYEHQPDGELMNGFVYTLVDNPIQHRLEEALAVLEGGAKTVVFASGTAAGAAYLQTLPRGSHVLFPEDLFYGYQAMVREYLSRWNIAYSFVDMTDVQAVESAVKKNTAVIWAETPSNPLMKVSDIAALANVAHRNGAKLIVDSTFASPALSRPLEFGADAVLHSTTKYAGGHSDVQSGAIVFADGDASYQDVLHVRKALGSVASPFSSWLVFRGLRTLELRMKAHSANATAIAEFLTGHRNVRDVYYPGLESHPGHQIARRQMSDFGGMLSFRVRGGRQAALATAEKVRLFINAGSLGGPESLIRHVVATTTPSDGIPDDLLRISVGLEDPLDLIEDLNQALG